MYANVQVSLRQFLTTHLSNFKTSLKMLLSLSISKTGLLPLRDSRVLPKVHLIRRKQLQLQKMPKKLSKKPRWSKEEKAIP